MPNTLEQIAGGIRHRMGQQPSAQYIFVPRDWLETLLCALMDAKAEALQEVARRIDDSESDVWSRDEIRDWLLFQADAKAEGRREQEQAPSSSLTLGSSDACLFGNCADCVVTGCVCECHVVPGSTAGNSL